MKTHEKAKELIEKYGKSWLAKQLKISRPTLDRRLQNNQFRVIIDLGEEKINKLYEKERKDLQ